MNLPQIASNCLKLPQITSNCLQEVCFSNCLKIHKKRENTPPRRPQVCNPENRPKSLKKGGDIFEKKEDEKNQEKEEGKKL